MTVNRAKTVFLSAVALCAGGFVLLIAKLPTSLRDGVILWVIFGLPVLFFALRVYRGWVQVTMERIAKEPQQPPPAPFGVGEHDRGHELRIIAGTDAKRERRLL
jgi:hypothetical protein